MPSKGVSYGDLSGESRKSDKCKVPWKRKKASTYFPNFVFLAAYISIYIIDTGLWVHMCVLFWIDTIFHNTDSFARRREKI